MKLSARNVTTLDTQPEIVEVDLQVLQVLERKIGKYQNNRQFGRRSKNICKLRNAGLLKKLRTQGVIGVLIVDPQGV